MNLGNNPRKDSALQSGVCDGIAVNMPFRRSARNHLPSHAVVLKCVLKCLRISLPYGETREVVTTRFTELMKEGKAGYEFPEQFSIPPSFVGFAELVVGRILHGCRIIKVDNRILW